MTTEHFAQTLLCAPFALAAGLWIYAFSLCGRTGRSLLSFGVWRLFDPAGRHTDERPTYEDEPVTVRIKQTEDERVAAYAAMRQETEMLPITPSAAPYTAWTAALHPTDLDELRASLDAVVADFQRDLSARMDEVLADFLRERTDAYATVSY